MNNLEYLVHSKGNSLVDFSLRMCYTCSIRLIETMKMYLLTLCDDPYAPPMTLGLYASMEDAVAAKKINFAKFTEETDTYWVEVFTVGVTHTSTDIVEIP